MNAGCPVCGRYGAITTRCVCGEWRTLAAGCRCIAPVVACPLHPFVVQIDTRTVRP